ncbi:apicoplast pyruvate carrier 1-like isoform X2 [Glandiceps talaboti]
MFFGGFFEKRFGPRIPSLIGGLIQSVGVTLTYFTVQYSFYAVLLTYGVMFGMGLGIAYMPPMACAMRWFPKKKGVACGMIVAGFGGGAFIFNQVQTAFINPDNLSPLESPSGEKYFNQKELLDRVPYCFLLMGGCYAALQIVGCLLLVNPPTNEVCSIQGESPETQLLESNNEENKDDRWSGQNLKPAEIIRTRAFWTLYCILFVNVQTQSLVPALYKDFGEGFIDDDHFLALVGSFASVGNSVGRIFWGHIADRFSFRVAMIILCSLNTILMLTLIASEHANRAMFFIWICAIFFTFSGNFSIFPSTTARSFGEEYMGMNYGCLFTAITVSSVMGTIIANSLLTLTGWVGLFFLCAAFSSIGAMLTFSFNVKTPSGNDI